MLKEADDTVALRYRRIYGAFPRCDLNSFYNKQSSGKGGYLVIVLIKGVGDNHKDGSFSRDRGVSLDICEKTLQHQETGTQRVGVKIGPSILFSSIATSGKEL